MTNKELATRIVSLLGGLENIISAENCMTRLRVNIKDASKVDVEALKNTQDVLGVMANEDHYIQVVLGPGKVRDVMTACTQLGVPAVSSSAVSQDWQKNKEAVKSQQKNGKAMKNIRIIADIFTPMIPAFIASGICNGLGKIVKILMANGTLPKTAAVLVICNLLVLIGNAFLSYLAIFTGVRAAKQFGVNEMLGGMIGAASLNAVINKISEAMGWFNADVVNDSGAVYRCRRHHRRGAGGVGPFQDRGVGPRPYALGAGHLLYPLGDYADHHAPVRTGDHAHHRLGVHPYLRLPEPVYLFG